MNFQNELEWQKARKAGIEYSSVCKLDLLTEWPGTVMCILAIDASASPSSFDRGHGQAN